MTTKIEKISDCKDAKIRHYVNLTEAQLRNELENEEGIFIAESPKVIALALERGYEPISLLCEEKHLSGDAARLLPYYDENCTIYTGDRDVLRDITGYKLTRGVLSAMRRKPLPTLRDTCKGKRLIGVIHGVCDTTNIGAIFRSASALGVDAIVLSKDSCDPLNRRSVRVSMGTVFTVPWTISENPISELKENGFATAALAISKEAITLDNPILKEEKHLAVIFGTEGDGLPQDVIDKTDYTVTIPMHHGVDSLNVAAASAVTFWELRNRMQS